MRYENMKVGSYYEIVKLSGSTYGYAIRYQSGEKKKSPAIGMYVVCTNKQNGYNQHTTLQLIEDGVPVNTFFECDYHGCVQPIEESLVIGNNREAEAVRLKRRITSQSQRLKALQKETTALIQQLNADKQRLKTVEAHATDVDALVHLFAETKQQKLTPEALKTLLENAGLNIS